MKQVIGVALATMTIALSTCPNARAESASCAPLVRSANSLAKAISGNADAYWAHRKAYLEIAGSTSTSAARAAKAQVAEQVRLKAAPMKQAMPEALSKFATTISEAQTQNCLTRDEILALRDATFKQAKRVNLDRFPDGHPFEAGKSQDSPTLMPKK